MEQAEVKVKESEKVCDLNLLKPEEAELVNKKGVKIVLSSEISMELYEKFFDINETDGKSAKENFIENKALMKEIFSGSNASELVEKFFKGLSMTDYIFVSSYTVAFFRRAFGQKKS